MKIILNIFSIFFSISYFLKSLYIIKSLFQLLLPAKPLARRNVTSLRVPLTSTLSFWFLLPGNILFVYEIQNCNMLSKKILYKFLCVNEKHSNRKIIMHIIYDFYTTFYTEDNSIYIRVIL